MNKVFLAVAVAAVATLTVSCSKNTGREIVNSPCEDGLTISVGAILGEYRQDEAAKSELVNTVRVAWKEGDKVYVYDGVKYLGELTAALDAEDGDRYAILSGTLQYAPEEGTSVLTLIHGPQFTSAPAVANGKIVVDMANQDSAGEPFVVYSTIDNESSSFSDTIVRFRFATSLIKICCTGGGQGTVENAVISGINTACELTLSPAAAPEVSGVNPGNIKRSGNGAISASNDGRLIFSVSLAPSASSSSRRLEVKQGKVYESAFPAATFNAGSSYTSVLALAEKDSREAVQLWEGGPYWATMNIGASSPEEVGYYFSYGNVEGFVHNGTNWTYASVPGKVYTSGFSDDNYKGTQGSLVKVPEDWNVLQNDAARVHWQGDWRLPTGGDSNDSELFQLKSKCYAEWTYDYNGTGVQGLIVYRVDSRGGANCFRRGIGSYSGTAPTSPYSLSDAHIFLPAGGFGFGAGFESDTSAMVGYLTDALCTDESFQDSSFVILCSYSIFYEADIRERYKGYPIRPVKDAL